MGLRRHLVVLRPGRIMGRGLVIVGRSTVTVVLIATPKHMSVLSGIGMLRGIPAGITGRTLAIGGDKYEGV